MTRFQPDNLRAIARAGTLTLVTSLLAANAAIAADPVFTTMLSFDVTTQGAPVGRPIWAAGSLYGTTRIGSTTTGVIYRVNPESGALTVVHTFPATAANGITNHYPLILGQDGALYGTRAASVVAMPPAGDEGSVGQLYRLPLSGAGAGVVTSVPLKSAAGVGFTPISALFQHSDGAFYGATYSEIFKVNPDGSDAMEFLKEAGFSPNGIAGISATQLLVPAFGGTINGISLETKTRTQLATGTNITTPTGIFARDADGVFYGTDKTSRVYKLTDQAGSQEILYTFVSPDGGATYPQGNQPLNYLALGYDGNLYGVTNAGGTNNKGVVFRVSPTATEASERFAKLYDFGSGADGAYPTGIIQGRDGKLYGTTSREGANNAGTLFSLDVGIEPPLPEIAAFTVTPATLVIGAPATLAWQSDNTANCTVTAGGFDGGAKDSDGELAVTPVTVATIEYTLTCSGSGDFADQSATQKVSVTVTPKLPVIASFSAAPTTLTLGQATELSWTSSETASCRIADGAGFTSAVLTSSGKLSVTPTAVASLTYTLTCAGSGAASDKSATKTVQVQVGKKSGGGGGSMAPGLLLLAGLALWRRRGRRS